MSPHPREHEEFLAALIAGELEANAAPVARRLAECATCRSSWETLRSVSERVEQAGTAQRALLDELPARSADAAEVAVLLQRLAEREPHARPPRRAFALAAAAVLLLALAAWLGRGLLREEPSRTWLGSNGLELLEPLGDVRDFTRFSWRFPGGADRYELRVYDERNEQVYADTTLRETTWMPPPEILAKFGKRISWTVNVIGSQINSLDSASASASRSSH